MKNTFPPIWQEMDKQLSKMNKLASSEPNLARAENCLQAAKEIFEECGLKIQSEKLDQILFAVGQSHKKEKPTLEQMMHKGITQKDLQEFGKGAPRAKAKINLALYEMGYDGHQIARFLGAHNVLTKNEAKELVDPARALGKIWDWTQNPAVPTNPQEEEFAGKVNRWIKDPTSPVDPQNPTPEEQKIERMKGWINNPTAPTYPEESPQSGDIISMKNAGKNPAKPRKPSRPDTKTDFHTKNLTPEKMIANLKNHGTEFNMANDGLDINNSNFDPEFADILGVSDANSLELTDLLDAEIEANDEQLADFDPEMPQMDDFEDEKDSNTNIVNAESVKELKIKHTKLEQVGSRPQEEGYGYTDGEKWLPMAYKSEESAIKKLPYYKKEYIKYPQKTKYPKPLYLVDQLD